MKNLKILITALLTLIGVISVLMTLAIIIDIHGFREKQGNIVWFIIYANLLCGFIYLYAAKVLWSRMKRAQNLLFFSLVVLIIAFIGLAFYIKSGGVYEPRTIRAMAGRTIFTAAMWLGVWYISKNDKRAQQNDD